MLDEINILELNLNNNYKNSYRMINKLIKVVKWIDFTTDNNNINVIEKYAISHVAKLIDQMMYNSSSSNSNNNSNTSYDNYHNDYGFAIDMKYIPTLLCWCSGYNLEVLSSKLNRTDIVSTLSPSFSSSSSSSSLSSSLLPISALPKHGVVETNKNKNIQYHCSVESKYSNQFIYNNNNDNNNSTTNSTVSCNTITMHNILKTTANKMMMINNNNNNNKKINKNKIIKKEDVEDNDKKKINDAFDYDIIYSNNYSDDKQFYHNVKIIKNNNNNCDNVYIQSSINYLCMYCLNSLCFLLLLNIFL